MQWMKELKTKGNYDVIICGGGPAGFAAGISAARLGTKAMLLEASGALGGMATQGLVTSYDGMADGEAPLVGGIMQKILDRMLEEGLLPEWSKKETWRERYLCPTKIKPEETKRFMDKMAKEAGLDVLFYSRAVDVEMAKDEKKITGVVVSDIAGLSLLRCKTLIDATGDATIAAKAGAPFLKALQDTEYVMPATLCFTVANVDEEKSENPRKYAEQALADNHFRNPEVRLVPSRVGPGVFTLNAGHIFNFDATDTAQLSAAMIEGREVVAEHVSYLQKYVPGYADCVLVDTAPLMGVRESRRIIGEYILTKDDYISARHFPDQIGIFNKEPDQHLYDPTPENIRYNREERKARIGWLPPGKSYGLPYGILVPKGGWQNLWVPGRSASMDIFVHSSARVMPACAMMGEASGCAAVQHLQTGQHACDLDTATLVETLRKQGAILPQQKLSKEMTRGNGSERPATPVVRMSLKDPDYTRQ